MSVIEDTRKLVQDFLAPELRSISVRLDTLEKQRLEDKADLLKAIADGNARIEKQRAEDMVGMSKQRAEDMVSMSKQRAEDKADTLRVIADVLKTVVESKADLLQAIRDGNARLEKQRSEDKVIFLEILAGDRTHIDRRFNDLIDYKKMGQRVDKLEEDQQSKNQ